jgi:hypothetical protein
MAVLTVGATLGCQQANPQATAHVTQYQRIAFVCVPGPGADPSYAPLILREVEKMVPSRLGFLRKVDCVSNLPVDTSGPVPRLQLADKTEYDGVVVLVYSYPAGTVLLDMDMVDAKTGEKVWHHQLKTQDTDTRGRLLKHGYWTATTVKMYFYGNKSGNPAKRL